jgi:peptidoglycan hydrolase-like protein with peptidoglycan-binding domain
MKASHKLSIFSYVRSFILFRLFNIKSKFYYLLLCSSAPLLLGYPNVASATEQQIAQVIPAVGINRPSLKVGSQGEIVTELQAALKLLGYYNGAVNGKFNDATAAAVTQFKQAAGLTANSVVDAATWQRLFPGETNVVSSNTPLPRQTSSGFPQPTQTTVAELPRTVVISNPASTPEPRTAVSRSGSAQQLETVRTPSTTRRNATNRVSSSRPVQNTTSASATTRTTTTNRPGRTNNSSNSSTSATSTTTTNRSRRINNSSNSSTSATTRTNNSSTNTSSTTRQKPAIQYTAAGLPILRLGMRGEEVLELQKKLQQFGYLKTNPDGDFGAETLSAVKALQERYGMEPDGVAGGATWDILNRRRNRSQS